MSAYENHLARAWERFNATVEARCVECGETDEVHPDDAPNWMCVACWDRAHCSTCNGTTQIGAPWSPDSCPDCDHRPAINNPQPF